MDFKNICQEDIDYNYVPIDQTIGIENLYKLSEFLNGCQIYIPKTYHIFKKYIDCCIIEDFSNGELMADLVNKYNLSYTKIQSIIKENSIKK